MEFFEESIRYGYTKSILNKNKFKIKSIYLYIISLKEVSIYTYLTKFISLKIDLQKKFQSYAKSY